jgi:hypothetical protein
MIEVHEASHNPLDTAVDLANRMRLDHPGDPDDSHQYRRFLRIAYWLSVQSPDGVFVLPTNTLAPILRTKPFIVSCLRRRAITDGFLVEVAKHDFARKRATKFKLTEAYMATIAAARAANQS